MTMPDEGQIFNITRGAMLEEILDADDASSDAKLDTKKSDEKTSNAKTADNTTENAKQEEAKKRDIKKYGDMFLAIFLLGGTIGGLRQSQIHDS